jgi:hypothetical protein
LNERSGTVVFRFGKGGKQRSVPLPLAAPSGSIIERLPSMAAKSSGRFLGRQSQPFFLAIQVPDAQTHQNRRIR